MKKWYEVGVGLGHGYGVMADTEAEARDLVWEAAFKDAVDVSDHAKMWKKEDLKVKEICEAPYGRHLVLIDIDIQKGSVGALAYLPVHALVIGKLFVLCFEQIQLIF